MKVIDISGYQPADIDWAGIKARGIDGVIIKLSEGSYSNPNPHAETQYSGAIAHGLLVGAYHFFRPAVDARTQASVFWGRAQGKQLALGLWNDVEVADNQSPATVLQRAMAFQQALAALSGKTPGIYTGTWFWEPHTSGSVAANVNQYPLWISGYPNLPKLPTGWSDWALHQYTDKEPVPFGACDCSVTNWTIEHIEGLMGINVTVYGAPQPAQPAPAPRPQPAPAPSTVLSLGSRGEAVRALQNLLNAKGFSCGAADGVFGHATEAAVKSAQSACRITVDGKAGPQTMAALNAYQRPAPAPQPAPAPAPKPAPGTPPTLSQGAKGPWVLRLQLELNRQFPAYSHLRVDGDFGPGTKAVVAEFQKRHGGLSVDDIVGPMTWRALGVTA